jgi:RGM family protein
LAYHSTITLVQNWNGDFNCSYVGEANGGAAPSPIPTKDSGRFRNHDHHSSSNLHGGKVEDPYSNEKTVTSSSADRTTSLEPTARVYVRPERPPNSLPITGTNVVMESSSSCTTYQGRPEMTHCSFYGDPHLVTFNGDFQTCKVAGAWPLIDNAYLAVSVTNEAVVPGSSATATTKVNNLRNSQKCAIFTYPPCSSYFSNEGFKMEREALIAPIFPFGVDT